MTTFNNNEAIDLDKVIYAAYERVASCPDGWKADFCPNCLMSEIKKVMAEVHRCPGCGNWIIEDCYPCRKLKAVQ